MVLHNFELFTISLRPSLEPSDLILFGQRPNFMAIGEFWLSRPVNRELHLQAPSHHDSPVHCPQYCRQSTDSTVDLLLHLILTSGHDPKVLELIDWGQL